MISNTKLYESKLDSIKVLVDNPDIIEFAKVLGMKYTNSHNEDEIIADFTICNSISDKVPKLEVRSFDDYLRIKVFAKNHIGLFATSIGVLLINGASVLKADVYSYKDCAFGMFYINEIFGNNLLKYGKKSELDVWVESLERSLLRDIDKQDSLDIRIENMKKRMEQAHNIFKKETMVEFEYLDNYKYNLNIDTNNRPALLYDIAYYIAKNRIAIESANIDTIDRNIICKFRISSKKALNESEIAVYRLNLIEITKNKNIYD